MPTPEDVPPADTPGLPQQRTASWAEDPADRAGLLDAWADAAGAADELGLELDLRGQAGGAGRARAATAHVMVVSGDPEAALRVLAAEGLDQVPPDGPRSMDHVVAIAARAALGDGAELSRLVAVGARLEAPATRVAYLYPVTGREAPPTQDGFRPLLGRAHQQRRRLGSLSGSRLAQRWGTTGERRSSRLRVGRLGPRSPHRRCACPSVCRVRPLASRSRPLMPEELS